MNYFIAGTDVAGVFISLVMLCAVLFSKEKEKLKNKYLITALAATFFFSVSDAVSYIMDEKGGNYILHYYSNLLSYLGPDFIITLFIYYISESIREKCAFSLKHARVMLICSILDMCFIVFGAYSGRLFRIENGHTVYGELANYIGVIQFAAIIYFLFCVIRRKKELNKKFIVSIAMYFLLPIMVMVLEFIDARFALSYLASVISFLIVYVILVQEDLEASTLGEKIMYKASITDSMTGLLNRKAYTDDLEKLNHRYPSDFVYMSLDLNGLKNANDNLGHAAGDEIIVGAAQCMTKCLGIYGSVYRTGGDEFTAMLRVPANQFARVLDNFEYETANWRGELIDSISISYGYVKADEMEGVPIDKVSILADERMYEAKAEFYKRKGVDRKGIAPAFTALCSLYIKILEINLTNDTYWVINMNETEKINKSGFADNISGWLHGFGNAGQVHKDDLDEYLKKTELEYLKAYFRNEKTSLRIYYRRKCGDGFRPAIMEMIPSEDYEENNQTLYLYVRNA